MTICTQQEIKHHLYIDDDAHDDWLDMMGPAVESAIIQWVGGEDRLYDDNAQVIPCVKTAFLVELAYQFRDREGPDDTTWYETGYVLNAGSTAFLTPLRKPRIA